MFSCIVEVPVCGHGPLPPKTYTDPAHHVRMDQASCFWSLGRGSWSLPAGSEGAQYGVWRALYAPPAGSGAQVYVHSRDATWPLLELVGAKFMAALPHSLNPPMALRPIYAAATSTLTTHYTVRLRETTLQIHGYVK